MGILNLTSTIGLIGLILFLIGRSNNSKTWSKTMRTIGITLMAVQIIIDSGLGIYDGFAGNSHR